MIIEKATEVNEELYAAMQSLIPQLGSHKIVPTKTEVESLLRSEASTLLLARHPGKDGVIAGLLTLAVYRVPTGIRSIVEDVVVDEKFRRLGIAEGLLMSAVEAARAAGASNISLSANPSREAAHRLYQKMGFTRRDTTPYIILLK